jgi:hypothetical protein
MMNPFDFLASNFAFLENPELFASVLGGAGVPPPGMVPGLPTELPGTFMTPGPFMPSPNMGGPFGQQQVGPPGGPGPLAAAPPMDDETMRRRQLGAMSGLRGLQPGGGDRPITSGGISGAQQAPTPRMQGGLNSAVSDAILQALMPNRRPNPLIMPTLGMLMQGRA